MEEGRGVWAWMCRLYSYTLVGFQSLVSLKWRAGSWQSCQGGGIKGTRDQVKLVKAQKRTEAHEEASEIRARGLRSSSYGHTVMDGFRVHSSGSNCRGHLWLRVCNIKRYSLLHVKLTKHCIIILHLVLWPHIEKQGEHLRKKQVICDCWLKQIILN